MTCRQASTGYSHTFVLGPVMPALATRMSMPPESRDRLGTSCRDSTRIGDIDLNAVYLALDGGAGCIDGGLVHVPDRNPRSLACEPRGDTPARFPMRRPL